MAQTAQRGIALVAVLWVIALLTLLATAVVGLSVAQRRTVERYVEAAQADATADSAIRLAVLRLIAPPEQASEPPVGPQLVTVSNSDVYVTIEREGGRVDLNTSDSELLFALFAANGWSETDAHAMVARIRDWRDADDETREGGAESREYRVAGLSYEPRNGNFESVDELRQVLGSERIGAELMDAFTVYTHAPKCVEAFSSPPAKRALVWAEERQLGGHHWRDPQTGGNAQTPPAAEGSLAGQVVRVQACTSAGKGATSHCRRLIARVTGGTFNPLQVYEWRTVLPPNGPVAALDSPREIRVSASRAP